jgi:hypothetical protein
VKTLNAAEGIFAYLSLFILLSTGSGVTAVEQKPDLAIKGYDTVAYFKAGKAVKGSEDQGVTRDRERDQRFLNR